MVNFNQIMSDQPFVMAIVFMLLGAFISTYLKEALGALRKYWVSKSQQRMQKRLGQVVTEMSIARAFNKDTQLATYFHVAVLSQSIWLMAVALFLVVLAHIGDIGVSMMNNPIKFIVVGIAWLLFSSSVIRLSWNEQKYRNATDFKNFERKSWQEVEDLIAKLDLGAELSELVKKVQNKDLDEA